MCVCVLLSVVDTSCFSSLYVADAISTDNRSPSSRCTSSTRITSSSSGSSCSRDNYWGMLTFTATYYANSSFGKRKVKKVKAMYTVFHKIGTPLYFCNNILPRGPISIIDIPNCSAENWLKTCDTLIYITFIYYLKIVTSHPRQYLRVADI